jgi:hypothetical protein
MSLTSLGGLLEGDCHGSPLRPVGGGAGRKITPTAGGAAPFSSRSATLFSGVSACPRAGGTVRDVFAAVLAARGPQLFQTQRCGSFRCGSPSWQEASVRTSASRPFDGLLRSGRWHIWMDGIPCAFLGPALFLRFVAGGLCTRNAPDARQRSVQACTGRCGNRRASGCSSRSESTG